MSGSVLQEINIKTAMVQPDTYYISFLTWQNVGSFLAALHSTYVKKMPATQALDEPDRTIG